MIKIGIIGATGYTGLELLSILSGHPQADVRHIAARSAEGKKITDTYPVLLAYKDKIVEGIDIDKIAKDSDVVFTALPHAASAAVIKELNSRNVRVIDLSADFRYNSLKLYEDVYKVTHPCPELMKEAVYGLPEINREKIKSAAIVGNPGCYTTSAILPLYPLLKEKMVSDKGIIVDSASGVSGAGRKAEVEYAFTELFANFKAYAVTNHRHTSEIEEILSLNTGSGITLDFTPHLLPLKRGILSTIYTDLKEGITEADIQQVYGKYYGSEPFVTVSETLPEIRQVVYSNHINIGYRLNKKTGKLIIISALDNLTKGASGQAVQNMNIMFDIEETAGLNMPAKFI